MRKIKEEPKAAPSEESVRDVSKKLTNAIADGDRKETVSAARAAVFESANAAKEVEQPEPMRRIVAFQMSDDEDPSNFVFEMKELEDLLDSTKKPGHQVHALEQAETNARRAFRLLIKFREIHQIWEMDNAVLFGSMWAEASKALQHEKDKGYRSKQITDRDVEGMVASMFPDEWRAQEIRRLRAKQTEKSLEHLVEMWGSKCRSLNVLVGKGR